MSSYFPAFRKIPEGYRELCKLEIIASGDYYSSIQENLNIDDFTLIPKGYFNTFVKDFPYGVIRKGAIKDFPQKEVDFCICKLKEKRALNADSAHKPQRKNYELCLFCVEKGFIKQIEDKFYIDNT